MSILDHANVRVNEFLLTKVLKMGIHRSEGKENEVWQRFLHLLISAIILESMVTLSWNDSSILNSIVHESVVSGLVVVLEKAVKQIWPSLKTLL